MKDIAPILAGKSFPKLKHLGLRNCEFVDEIAGAIPEAAVMKQIETLDLSKGTMTDEGVSKLAAKKSALAHLRRLVLSHNYIGKASTLAATIAAAVRTRPQRTADEGEGEMHRYAAVGE